MTGVGGGDRTKSEVRKLGPQVQRSGIDLIHDSGKGRTQLLFKYNNIIVHVAIKMMCAKKSFFLLLHACIDSLSPVDSSFNNTCSDGSIVFFTDTGAE